MRTRGPHSLLQTLYHPLIARRLQPDLRQIQGARNRVK
jgi:hypothetical protein